MAKVPFNITARESDEKKPPTFGQKRAEELEARLEKALRERRKLYAAEQASDEPVKTAANRRGGVVERSIARLQKLLTDAD